MDSTDEFREKKAIVASGLHKNDDSYNPAKRNKYDNRCELC